MKINLIKMNVNMIVIQIYFQKNKIQLQDKLKEIKYLKNIKYQKNQH